MIQHWRLHDVGQKQPIDECRRLGDFFFSDPPDIYDALRIPCLPKGFKDWARGSMALQPGPLGKLPFELLDAIFVAIRKSFRGIPEGGLRQLLEVVILSVTCKGLFSVGKTHIEDIFLMFAVHANSRLICIGDYSEDVPHGMLKAAEIREVEEAVSRPAHRYYALFAREYYLGSSDVYSVRQGTRKLLRERITHNKSKNPRQVLEMEMINSLLWIDEITYPEGPNVLGNHSNGEYVREDKLVVLHNGSCQVTLVHALMSRICWSSKPDSAMAVQDAKYSELLFRGPWAGHRFQIFTAEEFVPGTMWKDVTEEVNEMLLYLWDLQQPEDEDM